jgi:hypothetical protein
MRSYDPDRPAADPPPPVEVEVRCNGKMHRIDFDGQTLRLLDHPDLRRDRYLYEFGGCCRCLEVLGAWQDVPGTTGARGVIPHGLRDAYDYWRSARARARSRLRLPEGSKTYASLWRVKAAVKNRVRQEAMTALLQCGYRIGKYCSFRVEVGSKPGVERDDWLPTVNVTVGGGWYARVFRRGISVIKGRFVLAVLTRDDVEHRRMRRALGHEDRAPWWVAAFGENPDLRNPCVLALYQGRGNSLHARPAVLGRRPALSWLPVAAR